MYDLSTSSFVWSIIGSIVLVVLLIDWDWKRRLFETYHEKMKRDPKFRDKELKRRLRNTPWLIPGNKSWHEMQEEWDKRQ